LQLEQKSLNAFLEAVKKLDDGFAALPEFSPSTYDETRLLDVLKATAERLHDNYPYFHPLYAGQMLKPPHPIARAAYALAMSINPNNHALDGGRASSAMEIEAIAALAKMFHWPQHLGHLSSGGTFANLEALWVAGQLVYTEDGTPKAIAASDQAHYTHSRISGVLGLPFISLPSDEHGRIEPNSGSIEVNSSHARLSVSPSRSFWRCPGDLAVQNCSQCTICLPGQNRFTRPH